MGQEQYNFKKQNRDGTDQGKAPHPITTDNLARHQQNSHSQLRSPSQRVQDYQRSAASYAPGQRPSAEEWLKQWTDGWNELARKKKE